MSIRQGHKGAPRAHDGLGVAERLVLEGYRHAGHRPADCAAAARQRLRHLYGAALSGRDVRQALAALDQFVATLGLCARCPLHLCEAGSPRICDDERLILALIAAIQNGDDALAETCLRALTCHRRCEELAVAAGSFALIMKALGQTLAPVPGHAVDEVLAVRAGAAGTTMH
ncbi:MULTISPECIES: hypothetical protein [unclassified Roseitalea]|uniref:hypothetical protein n=1 Tax=unclassified Roseitalea TaxID=2639107 RepID=UPI00273DDE16|nr:MULTISPECIES: hypothetical protein [unclassified Roseitalea]